LAEPLIRLINFVKERIGTVNNCYCADTIGDFGQGECEYHVRLETKAMIREAAHAGQGSSIGEAMIAALAREDRRQLRLDSREARRAYQRRARQRQRERDARRAR